MRAVVQRVKSSSVTVEGECRGAVGPGLNILLGVETGDTEEDLAYLADKIANLRIFKCDGGKMNRSILETGGEALVISQFTLCADCRKGRRPSFTSAAEPGEAERMYELFVKELRGRGVKKVEKGVFGADMQVGISNDGPVTIVLNTKEMRRA